MKIVLLPQTGKDLPCFILEGYSGNLRGCNINHIDWGWLHSQKLNKLVLPEELT